MKFSDAASGIAALVFGIAVAVHAQSFPPMPGQPIGPSFFPAVLGGALGVAGIALIVGGARGERQRAVQFDAWIGKPRMVLNFVLVFAMLLFYATVLQQLGFFVTALLFLMVLFVAFGVTRKWVVPLSLAIVLLIHYGFYTLLRVPLPWGVLEGVAW